MRESDKDVAAVYFYFPPDNPLQPGTFPLIPGSPFLIICPQFPSLQRYLHLFRLSSFCDAPAFSDLSNFYPIKACALLPRRPSAVVFSHSLLSRSPPSNLASLNSGAHRFTDSSSATFILSPAQPSTSPPPRLP